MSKIGTFTTLLWDWLTHLRTVPLGTLLTTMESTRSGFRSVCAWRGVKNINTWSSDCIPRAILGLKLCLPLISFKIVVWTIWSARHLCITYSQNWGGWHARFSPMVFQQVMSHSCERCASLIKDWTSTESASGIVSCSLAMEKFKTTEIERTTVWSGITLHCWLPRFVLCHVSSAGCESTGGLAARSGQEHLYSNVCHGRKL